ncbi:AAA family ATPase [Bradyrhizobium sp. Pha-3]|uniref:trifunctional serine/threonine-protein kinase/ATP-binding protein/sensor histidine kinase n=1 Tax=Bradyrhizobium sp. Pha-3 TaxID=208375 RepID=UPI0035D43E1C
MDHSLYSAGANGHFQILWEDGERVFCRGAEHLNRDYSVLAVFPAAEHPTPAILDRLSHEYKLKNELDSAWAARPIELIREAGRTILVIEDHGGEPLEQLLGEPMEIGLFLRLATSIAVSLGKLHLRGLIHRDIKPVNILVNRVAAEVKLTGFGLTSRLPRERQSPQPPEIIAGTLAYMAPEQTGRMNRSIDSRSDLYALGVTLYQMLTATLPFAARDPVEWVHCHIARLPLAPTERSTDIPTVVSAIVMKLLAKIAEDRYQTAAGLEYDLRRCLVGWEASQFIDIFPLGEQDTPDRLLIPEKLYGREREIETLLSSFDRVASSGTPELVLVSGYSGIGKSAVVNELHKVLILRHGLFASGKFDQYRRDMPYATLAQALQSLIRQLLSQTEADLVKWRDSIAAALGSNGLLIVELVPELKLIIGEQPAISQLPPLEAKARFQLTFQRFLGVFACQEHPLALFLDDLQWLDGDSLDLIETLLTQTDVHHLLLIGAYRDNEVTSTHPLIRKLEVISQGQARTLHVNLAPLARDDLMSLVLDTLRCEQERAAPLTDLIYDKTAGAPFFIIQFISALVDDGLLSFDHPNARWRWELSRIQATAFTDNVVDLMVAKLSRLPIKTQEALQQLSCIGNNAGFAMLSVVCGLQEEEVHANLWDARRAELVVRSETSYEFVHDRVREAAYSRIPEARRANIHLRIGRLLAARTPSERLEEAIFEIVNQLNRGAALISSQPEKAQLAELNLFAGKRAKASMAHASALNYLVTATSLLSDDSWEQRPALMFALELHRAECEFLTGATATAEARLTMLSSRAANPVDLATVACLRIDLYTAQNLDRAVDICLDYLRRLGIDWSPHPTEEEARREYEQVLSLLGQREIEALVDLPLMSDPHSVAILDVLIKALVPASFTDPNLFHLLLWRMVSLSIEHGNTDASCPAYVQAGRIICSRFGNYKLGFRFGRLGYDLVERRGLKRFQARTYLSYAVSILSWTKHWRVARGLIRKGFDVANSVGDLTYAAFSCQHLIPNLLASGEPLPEVQCEAENCLTFVRSRFGPQNDIITTQLALIRTLRGLTTTFGCFSSDDFDELSLERRLSSEPRFAFAACSYWTRKLQARFFAGEFAEAVVASSNAQQLLWTAPSFLLSAEAHFYGALSHAASCDAALPTQYQHHFDSLIAHHKQLVEWADNCPANFENRKLLVGAEIARIEGRELDAERLYEAAIKSARRNEFVNNEGLANELAARFHAARGFETIAHAYLREARSSYIRWGAEGKVKQLERLHPHLRDAGSSPAAAATTVAPLEQLDLATVLNVSQAVSSEIVLEKLIDTLMRTALEQAGAERGLLIIPRGAEPRIAAEATISDDTIAVCLHDHAIVEGMLPGSVLQYVLRTHQSVIIDDAATQTIFAADPYIRQHQARSILCLPLLNQAKLIGVLFLENRLAPGVFAPPQVAVLKLVSSQAAIALEISRLYGDLQEREAKIRRLVDANIVGILIYDLEGRISDANDAFLRMVGYDREDLITDRMRWTDLTPPEWRERDMRAKEEVQLTGTALPYEKEFFRKDGSRVPILIGAASFEETGKEGAAFVLDLTDRKRAEAEARESEQRYREIQLELTHANRVSTMGQLTASIAHEVNQPITAMIGNAEATLRWLGHRPPNLEESRLLLARIGKDGHRASDIVSRIRDLTRKAPPRMEFLEINQAIGDVIEITRGEAMKNNISVRTTLADDLPLVEADRTQLQQVILNLIINGVHALSESDQHSRELLISTSMNESQEVSVSVRDSGPGVNAESVGRLFDPFYTTKTSGMGMGLSICRSIIEGHGGRIWATANAPRGAAFHFTIPPAYTSRIYATQS